MVARVWFLESSKHVLLLLLGDCQGVAMQLIRCSEWFYQVPVWFLVCSKLILLLGGCQGRLLLLHLQVQKRR